MACHRVLENPLDLIRLSLIRCNHSVINTKLEFRWKNFLFLIWTHFIHKSQALSHNLYIINLHSKITSPLNKSPVFHFIRNNNQRLKANIPVCSPQMEKSPLAARICLWEVRHNGAVMWRQPPNVRLDDFDDTTKVCCDRRTPHWVLWHAALTAPSFRQGWGESCAPIPYVERPNIMVYNYDASW